VCHSFVEELLLHDPRFYPWLAALDRDLAQLAREGGCLWCGARLHGARYPRKPRGGPQALADDFSSRHSFCCSAEGCRRRVTPPSVRFLGRRAYLGAVVVLVSAMLQGTTPPRARHLRELFGVSAETLKRWRGWWRETFAQSRFWRAARGQLHSPIDAGMLPLAMLDCFVGPVRDQAVALLEFLRPITTLSGKSCRGLASAGPIQAS
jgi:hypothetical protein